MVVLSMGGLVPGVMREAIRVGVSSLESNQGKRKFVEVEIEGACQVFSEIPQRGSVDLIDLNLTVEELGMLGVHRCLVLSN